MCGLALVACACARSARSPSTANSGPPERAAAPPPASVAPDKALGGVESGAGGGWRFVIGLAGCGDVGCGLDVRATGDKAPPLHATLDWMLPSGPQSEVPITASPTDALFDAPPKFARRWQLGVEERAVSVTARPIRFGPSGSGLIVDLEAGFDHVKRRHALVLPAALGGGPAPARSAGALIWDREDGAGPHLTLLGALEHAGGEWPVYIDAFRDPSPDVADSLAIRILRMGATQNGIEEASPGDVAATVPALLAGRFGSIVAARKARSGTACLAPMLVLPSSAFPGERKRGFVLAQVGTRKDLVEAQARQLSSCAKRQGGVRIGSWRGSP